jgi:antitoxin component YwqK of YwqJK toxin-antitoxin module
VGTARFWFGKNRPKHIVRFEEGKRHGKEEEFYATGQLKALSNYKNGLLDGEVKTWYENSLPWSVKHFQNGLPVKEHKEYFPNSSARDGTSQQLMRYFLYNNEGKFHGEQRSYHPSGALNTSIEYQNGELHGRKALWDQDGNLIEEAWYEKGKLNGRFFERKPNGSEILFHYKDNKREGVHEIYYPYTSPFEKIKALEATFRNDLLESEAFDYDEQGNKVGITPYLHGKKEGMAQIFTAKGKLTATIELHEDQRHGESREYYPDGQLYRIGCYVQNLKNGEEKTYFPSGQLAKVIPYKEGQVDGLYQEWNEEGILIFEGEYTNGKKEGKFNKYYPDGNPFLLQTFMDDVLHGIKKKYAPDGTCFESRYDRGKKIESIVKQTK